ncbi:phage tail protein S [Escherichia coli]|uniref:Phage tail protein S n=1 Tax=Escherichia coli TaxID=562 RepID=A0A377AZ13_ECOLX|nr:phage tail protein S [Escherichia coli]
MKAMDKTFTRVDETFEAIRDSLNQQAINNIARKLAQDFTPRPAGAYPVTESAGRDRVDTRRRRVTGYRNAFALSGITKHAR